LPGSDIFYFPFPGSNDLFPVNSDKCTPFSIPGCTCRSQLDFIAYTFTDANFWIVIIL